MTWAGELNRRFASVSGSLRQLLELACSHMAVYAFPLAFAVISARALGPENYGRVSFYTSLVALSSMFIEFGFDWIGIREVNAAASQQTRTAEDVLWSVTLAKTSLFLATCAVIGPLLLLTRDAHERPMIAPVLTYLLAFALDTDWYLRWLQRTRIILLTSAISRVAGVALLAVLVTHPGDAPTAMWCYTSVVWISAAMSWAMIGRLGRLKRPRIDVSYVSWLFRTAGPVLAGNMNAALLQYGGIVMLGMLADPVTTGAANVAVRVKTAAQAVLLAPNQVGFLALSRLAAVDCLRAMALGRRIFPLLMGLAVVVSIALFALAGPIMDFVYKGHPVPYAVHGLLLLAGAAIPLNIAAGLFGQQCLTLLDCAKSYAGILAIASVLFAGVLLLLARHDPLAYGWALLAAEFWIAMAAGLRLRTLVRRLHGARTPAKA